MDYQLVQATVLDASNRTVRGLKAEDFVVLEDTQARPVEHFSPPDAPWNIVVIIDSSVSTAGKTALIREASNRFVERLVQNNRVAIIETGCGNRLLQDLTSSLPDLKRAISALGSVPDSCTQLRDALALALSQVLAREQGRSAIVLFSDGVDTGSRVNARELQALASLHRIPIFPLLSNTLADEEASISGFPDIRFQVPVELMLVADSESGKDMVRQAAQFAIEKAHPTVAFLLLGRRKSSAVQLEAWTTDRSMLLAKVRAMNINEKGREYNVPMDRPAPNVAALLIAERVDQAMQTGMFGTLAKVVTPDRSSTARWQSEILAFLEALPRVNDRRTALEEARRKHLQGREYMTSLSTATGGVAVEVKALEDLERTYGRIAGDLGSTYTLGFRATKPGAPVEVRLAQTTSGHTLSYRATAASSPGER